jgi:hypothetical protein
MRPPNPSPSSDPPRSRAARNRTDDFLIMAKLSVPGKMPPAVAILLKHHFWLLALLVPLVLVPLLFMAEGNLREQITAMQGQIKGAIDGLRGVRRIPQHPNSSWTSEIDASTKKVKLETFAEWKKFWDSQKSLRVWPAKQLGADFVKAVESLKPGGSLPRPMLERYQDRVRGLVRELPGMMGAENAMTEAGEAGGPSGGAPLGRPSRPPLPGLGRPGAGVPGEAGEVSPFFLTWNAPNQNTIYASFNWETPPTTTKILLAQEELRVYGLLCELIARMNKSGTGPHNVAIAAVDELFVGYPAAEDNPGGVGGGRITVVAPATADPSMGMAPPDMPAPGMEGAAVGRPPHPRFTGAISGGGGMPGDMAASEPANPDEQLRNWIYVDFTGKPLSAAELASAVDAQMVHLLPFVLRIVIDQRQIDVLLTELATSTLPIDVRQLRINAAGGPGGAAAAGMSGAVLGAGGVPGGDGTGSRLYDVTLELRGSVGLATEPNEEAVGLEPGEGAGQPAAPAEPESRPAAKAAATVRRERWRLAS